MQFTGVAIRQEAVLDTTNCDFGAFSTGAHAMHDLGQPQRRRNYKILGSAAVHLLQQQRLHELWVVYRRSRRLRSTTSWQPTIAALFLAAHRCPPLASPDDRNEIHRLVHAVARIGVTLPGARRINDGGGQYTARQSRGGQDVTPSADRHPEQNENGGDHAAIIPIAAEDRRELAGSERGRARCGKGTVSGRAVMGGCLSIVDFTSLDPEP